MKTILVDAVNAFIIIDNRIFNEMFNLLEEYPNKKIILTGANDEQMKIFGLDDMPYEVFTLKHDPEKSEPEYYKIFLKQFNLDVNDLIYFEHNEEAVKSAQSVGIKTFHYDKDKKDLKALKKFLDENV
jgi:HAD superfamily hydrolase (TIGR01509 family)